VVPQGEWSRPGTHGRLRETGAAGPAGALGESKEHPPGLRASGCERGAEGPVGTQGPADRQGERGPERSAGAHGAERFLLPASEGCKVWQDHAGAPGLPGLQGSARTAA